MSLDSGSRSQQTLDHRNGRTFAHVIGLGLEGKAPNPDALSRKILPQISQRLLQDDLLLALVDMLDSLQHVERKTEIVRRANQRFDVLGKTAPAVARPGIQERPADPLVRADSQPDVIDIGADQLA